MKVVIVEFDGEGGMLHFAQLLADGLAAAGAEVMLVTDRQYELAHLSRKFQVLPVLRLWSRVEKDRAGQTGPLTSARRLARRAGRAAMLVREWIRVRNIVRRQRPDLTLFSIVRFPIEGFFLSAIRRDGIRTAQICHEFEAREERDGWQRRATLRLNAIAYRSFQDIFFLSRATRDAFLSNFPDLAGRTHVIPHGPSLLFGVNEAARAGLGARYGTRSGERTILMFGGLRPSKGVPDLVEAFALMQNRHRARLVIAGYPSKQFDIEGVRSRVHALGLDNRVSIDPRYLPVEDLGALVSLADVVVFPYRSATASGALSLAQVLGRSVVASNIGGLAEEIEDGLTGLLVPPGDRAALARALDRLVASPELAAMMGEAGRAAVLRSRSWPAIGQRILDVCLTDGPTAAPAVDPKPDTVVARR